MNELLGWYGYDGGGEDEDGADESDVRLRTRSIGDSSGPECSGNIITMYMYFSSNYLAKSGKLNKLLFK